MNKEEVRKIIVGELNRNSVDLNQFEGYRKCVGNPNPQLAVMCSMWDKVADNILANLPDNDFEVIARGKAKNTRVFYFCNDLDITIRLISKDTVNIDRLIEGKNIEIAIRVLPDKGDK